MKSTILFPLMTSSILARAAASYSGSSPSAAAARRRGLVGAVEAVERARGCVCTWNGWMDGW